MNKKVLVLSGSPRIKGNSDILCDEFVKGAKESNNEVVKIRIAEKNIHPCLSCYYCSSHNGKCIQNDDMKDILDKILDSDVIVLSTPVYFYSICSQLKTVIDRTLARWEEVKNKEFYFIVTMADEDIHSADTTLACLKGYVDCVDGGLVKGTIIGNNVYQKGEINNTSKTQEAYLMGKNI